MFRIFPALGPVLLILLVIADRTAHAHEFWIEPAEFRIEADGVIAAELRIGQNFKGDRLPYLPTRFERFEIADGEGAVAVTNRTGAMPALEARPSSDGMQILTYLSAPDRLQFGKWDTFAAYLEYEGLGAILQQHEQRGLPQSGFTEIYIRCAKALVMAGSGTRGEDRPTGMPLELVLLGNPFGGQVADTVEVRLLWQGSGLDDFQINVFRKGRDGPVARVRTSNGGVAVIPVVGPGPYLLNAVHMEAAPPQSGAAWRSHWASLTFAVGE